MAKKKSKTEAALELASLAPKYKQLVFVPTGSTLLNLGVSQLPDGGWPIGTMAWIVGQSGSGKTMLGMLAMAEACQLDIFDNYRLIVDSPENGGLMNTAKFFGQRFTDRVQAPTKSGEPSRTGEEFYANAGDAIKAGPCIYLLDSMDALTTNYDISKGIEQNRLARGEIDKTAGDYGDGKARMNSRRLRVLVGDCEKNGSLLIIISQTRDNIGDMFNPETVSGGRALEYYAGTQVWVRKGRELKKTVASQDYEIGVHSHVRIAKNRVDGNRRKVSMPIYNTYGVDDTGSMVDWMVNRGFWYRANADGTRNAKKGACINTGEDFGLSCKREKLIHEIENQPGWLDDLKYIVAEHWREIESKLAQRRRPRYE